MKSKDLKKVTPMMRILAFVMVFCMVLSMVTVSSPNQFAYAEDQMSPDEPTGEMFDGAVFSQGTYALPVQGNFSGEHTVVEGTWNDVLLTPVAGDSITLKDSFYLAGDHDGAVIFNAQTVPEGEYTITVNSFEYSEKIRIVSEDTSVITTVGNDYYSSYHDDVFPDNQDFSDDSGFSYLRQAFDNTYPSVNSSGSLNSNYIIDFDPENVLIKVEGLNLKPTDIKAELRTYDSTAVASLAEVVPLGKDGSTDIVSYMMIFEQIEDQNISEARIVVVQAGTGESVSRTIYNNKNLNFYTDVSDIKNLDITLVPYGVTPDMYPDSMDIRVFIDSYNEATQSDEEIVILESTIVEKSLDNKYSFKLPSNRQIFYDNNAQIEITIDGTEYTEYLSQWKILDGVSDVIGANKVDGYNMGISPKRSNFDANPNLVLVNESFVPVNGVTIMPNPEEVNILWKDYQINAPGVTFTNGEIYHIMYGNLPISTFEIGEVEEGTYEGDRRLNFYNNYVDITDPNPRLSIYEINTLPNLNEWTVDIYSVKSKQNIATLTVANGGLELTDTDEEDHNVRADIILPSSITEGPYYLTFKLNGVAQNDPLTNTSNDVEVDGSMENPYRIYESDEFMYVLPEMEETLTINNINPSYSEDDNGTINPIIYIDGYVADGMTSVSGLKLHAYKLTENSIAYKETNPIVVNIPADNDISSSGRFYANIASSALKAAGMSDEGYYLFAVYDSTGALIDATMDDYNTYVTDEWLLGAVGSYSIQGTLSQTPEGGSKVSVQDATVQLLKDGQVVAEQESSNVGGFSFSQLVGGNYTLKVLAGRTWAEHNQNIDLTSALNLGDIDLPYTVPTYEVSGIVSADTVPVEGITVQAYNVVNGTVSNSPIATVQSGADGKYMFRLPDIPGEVDNYVIKTLDTPDYKPYTGENFEVNAADITDENIALDSYPYLTGKVTLNGEAMSDINVTVRDEDGSYVSRSTSFADGTYTVKKLDNGATYQLYVYGEDYGYDEDVELTVDGKNEHDIELVGMVDVTGTVKNSKGDVVEGISIRFTDNSNDDDTWYDSTDENGNFEFYRVPNDGTYTVKTSPTIEYEEYSKDDVQITADAVLEDIVLKDQKTYETNFIFTTSGSAITADAYVSTRTTGDYDVYISKQAEDEITVASGVEDTVSIDELLESEYYYNYSVGNWSGSGEYEIDGTTESVDVNIVLPELVEISGTVTNVDDEPVQGVTVSMKGDMYQSTTTDENGDYSIFIEKTDAIGNVEIMARSEEEGAGTTGEFALIQADMADKDIVLKKNDVTVTVEDTEGKAIIDASVTIGSLRGYTDEEGTVTFNNLVEGEYTIYAYKSRYYHDYETGERPTVELTETETSVEVTAVLTYDDSTDYNFVLKANNDEVSAGSYVDIVPTIEYTGLGTPTASKFEITVPSELKVVTGSAIEYTGNSSPYETKYTINNVSFENNEAKLPDIRLTASMEAKNLDNVWVGAKVNVGTNNSYNYKYSSLNITVVNGTLQGPSLVKADSNFVVYGTGFTDASVTIKATNIETNSTTTIGSATVSNRYFSDTVKLSEGIYDVVALIRKDGATVETSPIRIEASDEVDEIENFMNSVIVKKNGVTQPPNSKYGFATFTAWVNTSYVGTDSITGSFTIPSEYTLKGVYFAGSRSSSSNFAFNKGSWSGTGTEAVRVVLSKDGVNYSFTIALVTIMIDPSGYVYDAVTGEKVEGATVTLHKLVGDDYVLWSDPDGLQTNPMTTDSEGKYGWMVENGTYQVTVEKEGYDTVISRDETGAAGGPGIEVPPVQTEVNIEVKYNMAATVTSALSEDETKIELTFTRPIKDADKIGESVTVKSGETTIAGTWTTDTEENKDRLFVFTPTTAFAKGSTVTIEIADTLVSVDELGIEATTLTVEIPKGSTGTSGSGSGSSSKEDELEDKDTEIMISADKAEGLTVDEISQNDDIYEELMEAVEEGYTVIGAFEIKVEEHNGELTITFPVDSEYNGKKFVVVHKLSSGDIEKYTGTVRNGKVIITVDELSPFMIAIEGDILVNPFTDVMTSDWFYEAIMYAFENGLFSGTSETTFSPDTAMTRAMMWTVLARMDGEDTTGGAMWYTKGMEWSMTNGISDGTTPDTNITREQLATMMYRYAEMKDYDMTKTAELSNFTDATDISEWAMKEMQWAVGSGLITGKTNDILDPLGEATRAEVATVLMRFVETILN